MNKNTTKDNKSQQLTVSGFQGYFSFLSNDFPTWVNFQGINFPSVSTAFQAARTDDIQTRSKIANVTDVQQFKSIAMSIKNPSDWADRKQKIMQILIRDKFKRNKEILDKLMGTKDKKLINTMKNGGFNQQFWGVHNGNGKNVLGRVLMSIRQQFAKGFDTKNWIQNNLNLENNQKMFATVELMVYKDGKKVQKLCLNKNKNYYLFGSLKNIDFQLQNPTISRNHACLYFNNDLQIMIVDLNSTHGTFLKRKQQSQKRQLEGLIGYRLYKDDILQFGTSAREYVVDINRSQVQKYIVQQQSNLKSTSKQASKLLQNHGQYSKLSKDQVKNMLGLDEKCLLIEDLKYSDNYHKLKQVFGKLEKVKNVRFKINSRTGKNQGVAVIFFENPSSANNIFKKKKQLQYKIKVISLGQAQNILGTNNQKKEKQQMNKLDNKQISRSRERSREKKQSKSSKYKQN